VALEKEADKRNEATAPSAGSCQRDMSTETFDKYSTEFIVAVYSTG
jgi:hypothetical protein